MIQLPKVRFSGLRISVFFFYKPFRRLSNVYVLELAATLESLEHRSLGHRPPPGSLSAQAQSLADKNAVDDGSRTLAEIQGIGSLLGGLTKSKGGSDGS